MAFTGLEKPKYAKITLSTDENGNETEAYSAGKVFAQAISAATSINAAKVKMYADNGVSRSVNEFVSGQITFGVDGLETDVEKDITGAQVDEETGTITNGENDEPQYIRFGFIVKGYDRNSKPRWRAIIFPRVMFDVPADDYETKGETIVFKSQTVVGEILRNTEGKWREKSEWCKTRAEAVAYLDDNIAPANA